MEMEDNITYGMCVHGENLATCTECDLNGQYDNKKIEFKKNDPDCFYLIEKDFTGEWLVETGDYKNTTVTKEVLKALTFDGDEGEAMATIFLGFNQIDGDLKDFKVTEHMFFES